MKTKFKTVAAAVLAVTLGTSSALAGVCQVTSSGWDVKQFCGLRSRGYAEGSHNTLGTGQKGLLALSTGEPGGFSSVTAVGLDSAGQHIMGCWASDEFEDGLIPKDNAAASIGQCKSAVNFIVQITY